MFDRANVVPCLFPFSQVLVSHDFCMDCEWSEIRFCDIFVNHRCQFGDKSVVVEKPPATPAPVSEGDLIFSIIRLMYCDVGTRADKRSGKCPATKLAITCRLQPDLQWEPLSEKRDSPKHTACLC